MFVVKLFRCDTNPLNQGYINRYNLIDTPSGICNFCETNKDLWFLHILKILYKFTEPFYEFELLLSTAGGYVTDVWSGTFFKMHKSYFYVQNW